VGQGIGDAIIHTMLLHHFVMEAKQFVEDFLLPRSVKPLFIEMDQTFVVSMYDEFTLH
jgi:hypothetical protein